MKTKILLIVYIILVITVSSYCYTDLTNKYIEEGTYMFPRILFFVPLLVDIFGVKFYLILLSIFLGITVPIMVPSILYVGFLSLKGVVKFLSEVKDWVLVLKMIGTLILLFGVGGYLFFKFLVILVDFTNNL